MLPMRGTVMLAGILASLLAACSTTGTPVSEDVYSDGFRGDFPESARVCDGNPVDAVPWFEHLYPAMMDYIEREGFGGYREIANLKYPTAWGYKFIDGELHIRYFFDEPYDDPRPDAPMQLLHGGLSVTVAACTGTFRYVGEFRWK